MLNRLLSLSLILALMLSTLGCGGSNSGGSGLKTSENLGGKELPLPKSPGAEDPAAKAKGKAKAGGGAAAQ